MCGIFGFQTYKKNSKKLREITSILLKISQQRGTDASGICVKYDSKNEVLKKGI